MEIKSIITTTIMLVSVLAFIACGIGNEKDRGIQTPSYNVFFNSLGGSAVADQVIIDGGYIMEPDFPVKTGYIFGGWYIDSYYSNLWDFENDTVSEGLILYAKWNTYVYQVTFNSQSATIASNPAYKTVSSPSTNLGFLPYAPSKTGYFFAGWYTDTFEGSTEFIATTPVTGNITVYAHWSSNPVYTVTFDGQSATTEAVPTHKTVVSPDITVGILASEPLKTGYEFGGWYTEPGGGGTQFANDTIVDGTITVYAKWNSYSYTVIFESQGATVDAYPAIKLVSSPSTIVGTLPTDPIKPGYTFGGWWSAPIGYGTQFSAGTPVVSNLIVYAKWNSNYNTITFDANGGTGSMQSQTIVTDTADVLTPNAYSKSGYHFTGWGTTSIGGVVYANGATFIMGTSSLTLYAKWSANNYSVSFDANGGSGTMEVQYILCDLKVPLIKNSFTNSESFAGWAISASGDVVYADEGDFTMGTESVTLFAKWRDPSFEFVTTGSSFKPVIVVDGTPEILWIWSDGTTSNSAIPDKNYGTDAKRINKLIVTPWSAIRRINIGYDSSDGGADFELVLDQNVESVNGMSLIAPYLRQWCSSYNIIKTLNFSNFIQLDTIECFYSHSLENVILKNTPALKRVCFEECNLKALDLSESPMLCDLRGAMNDYTTIVFGNYVYTDLWHICIRDNSQLTNSYLFSDMSYFPNIEELFIWGDAQTGELAIHSQTPLKGTWVQADGNQYSSADFSGAFQGSSGYGLVDLNDNLLTSIIIDDCSQLINLRARNNNLNSDSVDYILHTLDILGKTIDDIPGYRSLKVDLSGTGNAPPSVEGLDHVTSLRGKGWTVTVN